MSNGFGFNFSHGGDDGDDGDENRRGQNPFGNFAFGSGGLGDMLNQFGAMLSGMGSSMNDPDNAGPVNFDMAQRIARQQLGSLPALSQDDVRAVEESLRLADLWLDDSTALPTASATAAAWTAHNWLDNTLPMWKRLVTPVAEHMNSAQMESLPEEAREMMSGLTNMMRQMSGMNRGMQLGGALGDLAKQALTGADFGLPVSPVGTVALLPKNIQAISKDLDIRAQEVLVYVAAREAARQRLFKHVPWLVEHVVSAVEEYAVGLVIDTSHIEEAARGLNLESGNPQDIQDAMSRLQGMDLTPRITSRNAGATARLETLLALVEGWVDNVVYDALKDRFPSTDKLAGAWARRVATGGSAEHALSKVVGIEISAPRTAKAAELWRRSTVAVGAQKRDAVWDHPDLLPLPEHLDNPAAFIDGLLDDAPTDEFEEEFARLEEMLRQESGDDSSKNDGEGADSDDDNDGTAED